MSYLINLIDVIKDKIRSRKTLPKILKKLLGRAKFEALSLSCSDPRQWIDAGAVLYGTSVETFLDIVAKNYGLTALHVVPKTSALDSDNLQRCANAGCCFLRKDQVLLGVVTCIPERTSALMPEFSGIPRYLSSWKLIKEALENVDTNQAEYSPLERLFDIAQTHNADRLEICSAKFVYNLQTQDGKKASGNIAPELIENMLQLAQEKTCATTNIFNYQEHEYFVQKTGSVTSFVLKSKLDLTPPNLQIEHKVSPDTNNIIPISNPSTKTLEVQQKATTDKNSHVLLVDDNQSFTKVVSKYLGSLKIKTVVLNNGQEAVDYLDNNKVPSVIVCDLHMPQKNGFDVVRHIRGSDRLSKTPIIMLTSDQDIEAEIAFIELGVDAFLKKNQDPRLLTTQIKRLIGYSTNGVQKAA
jgi:CheY-like chemotaxis protein